MSSTRVTHPTNKSVSEFLAGVVPARRREDGTKLAEIFAEVTGAKATMWGPSIIGYGVYTSISEANPQRRGEWPKVGFSPRKARHSLYGLKDLPEGKALLPKLGKYAEGAGCVYISKLSDVDLDVLRQLIAIGFAREDETALQDQNLKSERAKAQRSEARMRKVFEMSFASVYPLYLSKIERKGRNRSELDEVIRWLTGFADADLRAHLENETSFQDFFANATINPNSHLIQGVVCGVRVEDIEDPLMQKIRYLDKLVDELSRGKAIEKILRA